MPKRRALYSFSARQALKRRDVGDLDELTRQRCAEFVAVARRLAEVRGWQRDVVDAACDQITDVLLPMGLAHLPTFRALQALLLALDAWNVGRETQFRHLTRCGLAICRAVLPKRGRPRALDRLRVARRRGEL